MTKNVPLYNREGKISVFERRGGGNFARSKILTLVFLKKKKTGQNVPEHNVIGTIIQIVTGFYMGYTFLRIRWDFI